MAVWFEHASQASLGAREAQEDACAFALADGHGAHPTTQVSRHALNGAQELIAVLADGMGGHVGGAEASHTACHSFISSYAEDMGVAPAARLQRALEASNAAIATRIARDPSLSGMGCTLLGAVFNEAGVMWVSVGDSPLFLYRRGEVRHLNEDHSLAPILDRLVEEGELAPLQARYHPNRGLLYSALTGDSIDLVDLSPTPLPLEAGDWVILASDGIHTLDADLIATIIAETEREGAESVVSGLLAEIAAIGDPYQDNTTIMAVRPQAP